MKKVWMVYHESTERAAERGIYDDYNLALAVAKELLHDDWVTQICEFNLNEDDAGRTVWDGAAENG